MPSPTVIALVAAFLAAGGMGEAGATPPRPTLPGAGGPAEAAAAPSTLLWYTHPADKWENALPVGNGRLGAMVFGRTDEETIQLNEDTYWSGGPYSTVVKGGAAVLPEIRKLVFEGNYKMAHILFGRSLMGYPVEQMKYQSLGDLVLRFPAGGAVADYRHELDLDAGGRPDDVMSRAACASPARCSRAPWTRSSSSGSRRTSREWSASRPSSGASGTKPIPTTPPTISGWTACPRRAGRARQVGRLHGRHGSAPLRVPAQGASPRAATMRPGLGRAQRDRRRRRDPPHRRRHELRELQGLRRRRPRPRRGRDVGRGRQDLSTRSRPPTSRSTGGSSAASP